MLCRYYSANGYCFYGDQCQFVHAKPSSNDGRTGTVNTIENLDCFSLCMFLYIVFILIYFYLFSMVT